jgi:hypothetical protein
MSCFRRPGRDGARPSLENLEQRHAPAVLTPTTFAVAGATFNGATRLLEGGLWQITEQESNQPTGNLTRYLTDVTNVRDTVNAERQAGGDLHNVPAAASADLKLTPSGTCRVRAAGRSRRPAAQKAGTPPAAADSLLVEVARGEFVS